jgi:tRNA dimethylallyltransferase
MKEKEKYLIVIGGATATGKTELAIDIARHFRTEILSADSRQFYREMTIGTAKPAEEELAAAPHHFVNFLSIFEEYSVGDYEKEALALLDELFSKHQVVVLAGGSGLFIRALCDGLDDYPDVPVEIKRELEATYREQGVSALQEELHRLDPDYFSRVDVNNPQRLLRALSVCRASGLPFSSFQQRGKRKRPFTPVFILLQMEREKLYDRINRRVDAMMEAGLPDEARSLYTYHHLNALQTVGYQELFEYFEGKLTLDKAVEKIKQNSRRYAKRQMTWFRKDDRWKVFSVEDRAGVFNYLNRVFDNRVAVT